jgi:hypothetical protein
MVVLLSACPAKDATGPVADPAGTVTSAIRIQGQGAFLIDFDNGTVSATNSGGVYDLYLDANVNFNVGPTVPAGQSPRRVAGVGTISGLGAITAVPSAGFVTTLKAEVGHGYVVQDNGRNWRVFVESLITSATSGGVIGVNIKWTSL